MESPILSLGTLEPELTLFATHRSSQELGDDLYELEYVRGAYVRRVRGKQMRETHRMFSEVSAALQFPWYFGWNWAAFDECMSDMAWANITNGFLLVIEQADCTLDLELKGQKQVLGRCLSTAHEEFKKHELDWNDERDEWNTEAVEFRVLLQFPKYYPEMDTFLGLPVVWESE